MKKNIKDNIHLYIDSDAKILWVEDKSFHDVNLKNLNIVKHDDGGVVLALRPLSDMKDDEAIELIKVTTDPKRHDSIEIVELTSDHIWYVDGELWHSDGISEMYDKALFFSHLASEQFRYLLSKGFDVFNLIDVGLGIDITKKST